ncbi:cuticle protein 19.8-like [Helicoverpa zea]|uniref:cuticle protein 19.8-like n=1 Tax=Helicoverpa zea TaxID=7113 RepID=UPI001F5A6CAE|nr:cuticle protein 19.8-like [Helicoverpa zea]
MVARILAFSALVAAATAVALPVLPVTKLAYAHAQPEAPAQYDFSYSVHDGQSGDVKQQQESRSGDNVHGSYSLVQPDGVHRIVDYTADEEHGFNAVVRYEGTPVEQPAKIAVAAPVAKIAYAAAPVAKIAYAAAPVAKIAYAPAPVAKIAYAPAPVAKVTYAAPVAKLAYAAPVAKVAYAPAQLSYSHAPAQISYSHAPSQVTYSQAPQISYHQAPVAYAAAPVAKVAYAAAPVAKLAYAENLGHVTFSSPAVSYHH